MFLILNVQTPQYDSEDFYVNVGLSVKELVKKQKTKRKSDIEM